jgi:hypothetical protein
MRISLVAVFLLLAAGCGREADRPRSEPSRQTGGMASEADTRPDQTGAEPRSIGPQFWKYDLSEYKQVEHDVMYGLGGRWISLRYELRADGSTNRDEMVARITAALTSDGWVKGALPKGRYVLSQIWETASDDLHFSRDARDGEPEHWFFNQTIHVGKNARVICLYAEVGW